MDAVLVTSEDGAQVLLGRSFSTYRCPPTWPAAAGGGEWCTRASDAFSVQVVQDRLRFIGIFAGSKNERCIDAYVAHGVLSAAISAFKGHFKQPLTVKWLSENFSSALAVLDELFCGSGVPALSNANAIDALFPEHSLLSKALDAVQPIASIVGLGPKLLPASSDVPGGVFGLGTGRGPGSGILGSGSHVFWRAAAPANVQDQCLHIFVVERVSGSVSSAGGFLGAQVSGSLQCTARLPGTPICTLLFKNVDAVLGPSSDAAAGGLILHPCVNRQAWRERQVMKFIPPQGDFELARYSKRHKKILPPVQLHVNIAPLGGSGGAVAAAGGRTPPPRVKLEMAVSPKKGFGPLAGGQGSQTALTNLVVTIALPAQLKNAAMGTPECSAGACTAVKGVLVWKINHLVSFDQSARSAPHTLTAVFTLAPTEDAEAQSDLYGAVVAQVHFVIPSFSVTGLRVDSVDVKLDDDAAAGANNAVSRITRHSTIAGVIEFTFTHR